MASRVTPARRAAFRLLLAMQQSRGAHSDDLLRSPAMDGLSLEDRHLTTALVMGVLRWQLALDAVVAPLLRKQAKLDDGVAIALRLGAFQLLQMDRIPAHAAISESVELTKGSGHTSASGLVNAVLRRVGETATRGSDSESPSVLDPLRAHPRWMLDRWQRHFGASHAAAIAGYDQQAPPATIRMETPGSDLVPSALLARARRLPPSTTPPQGARIQDEGSQLVAELAGRSPGRILDCCAAPGGKTAILAENNPQSAITACDISESRLNAMQRNFSADARTAGIECVLGDVTTLAFERPFDLVLCDAPCSGTGTLARNPEIKLRLAEAELERQQQRQIAILSAAFHALAPGGRLVYSTCSLEPEENEAVVQALLSAEPAACRVDVSARIDAMETDGTLLPSGAALLRETAIRDGSLQTIPGVVPCDGFYAAILTRL